METALRILSLRDHAERELRNKLFKKGYKRDEVEEVIEKLRSLGILDDRNFALKYALERRRKLFGDLKIEHELRTKGIKEEVIAEALKKAAEFMSEKTAAEILLRKRRGYPIEKNMRFLFSRGYKWDTIKELVKNES